MDLLHQLTWLGFLDLLIVLTKTLRQLVQQSWLVQHSRFVPKSPCICLFCKYFWVRWRPSSSKLLLTTVCCHFIFIWVPPPPSTVHFPSFPFSLSSQRVFLLLFLCQFWTCHIPGVFGHKTHWSLAIFTTDSYDSYDFPNFSSSNSSHFSCTKAFGTPHSIWVLLYEKWRRSWPMSPIRWMPEGSSIFCRSKGRRKPQKLGKCALTTMHLLPFPLSPPRPQPFLSKTIFMERYVR